jgi:hypothetical protein
MTTLIRGLDRVKIISGLIMANCPTRHLLKSHSYSAGHGRVMINRFGAMLDRSQNIADY